MPRESAAGSSPYMFPMLDEDLQMPEIQMDGLSDRLRKEG